MRIALFGMTSGLVLCCAVITIAQTSTPRDVVAPARADASRIVGIVVDADTRRPLRRAAVVLKPGGNGTSRWTLTDVEGRWAFDAVAAGSYEIIATCDGYVTQSVGQKTTFGPPGNVSISSGRSPEPITVSLRHGAVVVGHVTDERGEPIASALVQAWRLQFVNGQRQLVELGTGLGALGTGGLTDDRGEYRMFGIPPGSYYFSVWLGTPSPGGQSDDPHGYPRTYYPGTASVLDAKAVRVTATADATVNIPVIPTSLVTVTGAVINASGDPVSADLSLTPSAPGRAIEAATLHPVSGPYGTFTFHSVPQGEYLLHVRVNARNAFPEFAEMPLTVGQQDIRDLLLSTLPGGSISGGITAESGDGGAELNGMLVVARALNTAGFGVDGLARPNAVGAFTIPSLLGPQVIRLDSLPDGVWLKQVTLNGKDVTDSGVDVQSGLQTTVRVVVTGHMGAVNGRVVDSAGALISDYTVVAFADDEAKWGPGSRVVVAATPAADGTFQVRGLPDGNYVVIAVSPLDSGDEMDPDRLRLWRDSGTRIAIANGDSRTLTLVLAR
jgi:hypothetical protein